jgi:glycosyltransferase involved in cell wall biosynthesis
MKLLYLMTEPFGVGGVQSDILSLTENLTERGHEVYVATRPGTLLDELTLRGAHFIDVDFHFKDPINFIKAGMMLRKFIDKTKIDIVAPQSVRSTLAAYFALRLLPFRYKVSSTKRKLPIITTIHNIHTPIHFNYVGRLLNQCCNYVIFESHYERDRALASGLGEAKSKVVHSGIDTNRFSPTNPDPLLLQRYGLDKDVHKVFGIVARLSEEKGHSYLLSAFAKVYAEDRSMRLLVIGDGPLFERIKSQARSLGIKDAVVFTGIQRNIPQYLALMDVFVLSSTRESFPLAAREAMAAGKPVIAPRIGGCPEVVDEGKTGFLFETRNIEQLADAMCKIVRKSNLSRLSNEARKRAETLFSHQQWIAGDEEVYLCHLR